MTNYASVSFLAGRATASSDHGAFEGSNPKGAGFRGSLEGAIIKLLGH